MFGRIPLRYLLPYASFGIPLALFGLPLLIYLPPLYSQLPNLDEKQVGLAFMLVRFIDISFDFIIGMLSDNIHTRWGRRRVWIVAGVIVSIFSCAPFMMPPQDAGFSWLLGWALGAYLGWSLAFVPFVSWGAELSPNYHERTRIITAREIGQAFGTFLIVPLPALTLKFFPQYEDYGLWMPYLLLAITMPLSAWWVCSVIPEPNLEDKPANHLDWQAIRQIMQNRNFSRLWLVHGWNSLANGISAGCFIFFVTYVLGGNDKQVGIALVLYIGAGMLALPFWTALGEKYDKHRLWCFALLITGATVFGMTFLDLGQFTLYYVMCFLGGTAVGIDQGLPASMLADVADQDQHQNQLPESRTGIFFGLWGVMTKLSAALAIGIGYFILDMVGFSSSANTITNSAFALTWVAWLYAGIPILMKMIVVPIMWNYPLTREAQASWHKNYTT